MDLSKLPAEIRCMILDHLPLLARLRTLQLSKSHYALRNTKYFNQQLEFYRLRYNYFQSREDEVIGYRHNRRAHVFAIQDHNYRAALRLGTVQRTAHRAARLGDINLFMMCRQRGAKLLNHTWLIIHKYKLACFTEVLGLPPKHLQECIRVFRPPLITPRAPPVERRPVTVNFNPADINPRVPDHLSLIISTGDPRLLARLLERPLPKYIGRHGYWHPATIEFFHAHGLPLENLSAYESVCRNHDYLSYLIVKKYFPNQPQTHEHVMKLARYNIEQWDDYPRVGK